jgi:hypothetical protein
MHRIKQNRNGKEEWRIMHRAEQKKNGIEWEIMHKIE